MACCAFAVFILMQLLAPFTPIWQRLVGRRDTVNSSVAWALMPEEDKLVTATAMDNQRSHTAKRLFFSIVGIELLVLIVLLFSFVSQPDSLELTDAQIFAAMHESWCRAFDFSAGNAQTIPELNTVPATGE